MIKEEFIRYLKSYRTIILVTSFVILTMISCFFTYQMKMEHIGQLTSDTVNIITLRNVIAQYNGYRFFFESFFISDTFFILVLVVYAWIGIFLSSELAIHKDNGFGNWIVCRGGYKRYAGCIICAQSMYILITMAIAFAVSIGVSFAFGGTSNLFYNNFSFLSQFYLFLFSILFSLFIASLLT